MLISFLWTADVSSGATFMSFLPDVSLLITVCTFSWSHHSFNLDVFLFLTRGDRSEGIVKFHLDGCLLCCSHGLTPHCLSDQSWDEPIRTSDMTEVAHRRFTQNSATHVEPVHVSVPDVPVTRLWLEVQPGISVLFAFRCGIYVCLMSRFPLCLHVVPQVCAESEACGCEWVTDVHRSSRRVSCFKCFTFYLKDLFKSLTAVSKKLKFREVQLKNIIMSNLLWFSATYNIWWVCLLCFVSYWHF